MKLSQLPEAGLVNTEVLLPLLKLFLDCQTLLLILRRKVAVLVPVGDDFPVLALRLAVLLALHQIMDALSCLGFQRAVHVDVLMLKPFKLPAFLLGEDWLESDDVTHRLTAVLLP